MFLSRAHVGNMNHVVEALGFPVLDLGPGTSARERDASGGYEQWLGVEFQRDADDVLKRLDAEAVNWLVVDHYALDARWEELVRPVCSRTMAVDDLANRVHFVDLLLDQNLGRTGGDYEGKVPAGCKLMLGSRYALVRPEFPAQRAQSLARRGDGRIRKLLVTMGGVDLDDATGAVLEVLVSCKVPSDLQITVVMGPTAPWREKVTQQARQMSCNTEVLMGVGDMSSLMCDADLAIGAAGSTSWERCCMGLPTLLLVQAENQHEIAKTLVRAGAASLLERSNLGRELPNAMDLLFRNPGLLAGMSSAAAGLVDGLGVERVAESLFQGWSQ